MEKERKKRPHPVCFFSDGNVKITALAGLLRKGDVMAPLFGKSGHLLNWRNLKSFRREYLNSRANLSRDCLVAKSRDFGRKLAFFKTIVIFDQQRLEAISATVYSRFSRILINPFLAWSLLVENQAFRRFRWVFAGGFRLVAGIVDFDYFKL